MTVDTARSARGEMKYTYVDSEFREEPIATSIPAQLRFVDPGAVEQDTDRFHSELEDRGFSSLDTDPDRTIGGRRGGGSVPYYDGELCSTDHYNRLRVWVGRANAVRLFPRDEYVPTVDELTRIIEALEAGFGSPLEHYPIEHGDADD